MINIHNSSHNMRTLEISCNFTCARDTVMILVNTNTIKRQTEKCKTRDRLILLYFSLVNIWSRYIYIGMLVCKLLFEKVLLEKLRFEFNPNLWRFPSHRHASSDI